MNEGTMNYIVFTNSAFSASFAYEWSTDDIGYKYYDLSLMKFVLALRFSQDY
jgi:hypothetical protein